MDMDLELPLQHQPGQDPSMAPGESRTEVMLDAGDDYLGADFGNLEDFHQLQYSFPDLSPRLDAPMPMETKIEPIHDPSLPAHESFGSIIGAPPGGSMGTLGLAGGLGEFRPLVVGLVATSMGAPPPPPMYDPAPCPPRSLCASCLRKAWSRSDHWLCAQGVLWCADGAGRASVDDELGCPAQNRAGREPSRFPCVSFPFHLPNHRPRFLVEGASLDQSRGVGLAQVCRRDGLRRAGLCELRCRLGCRGLPAQAVRCERFVNAL